MKTTLITGGAGFIGSHMTDKMIHDGYHVVILDNLTTGSKSNVPKHADFIKGDVRQKEQVLQTVKKYTPDVVIHIAGQASTITSFMDPQFDIDVNFTGTANVTLACVQYGIPRLLFASSMTAYGHPDTIPTPESIACKPISYYGITKYAAERFVHATASRVDLKKPLHATSFRMFNVYGPRQSLTNPYQGAMAIFIGNVLRNEGITIFGDGKQSRDFIFIQDVADAWTRAIDDERSYGQVFNLGNGEKISINKLIKTIIQTLGQDPKTYPITYKDERPGDQRHMCADISQIKKVMKFTPTISFEQGLKRTIDWAKHEA